MKTSVKALSIVLILTAFFCNISICQTTDNQEEDIQLRSFGFGINFQQGTGLYPTPGQFIFSLNVEDKFRVEPKFGFSSSSFSEDDEERSWNVVGIGVYGLKYISQILFTYGMEYNHFSDLSEEDSYGDYIKSEGKANGIGPSLGLEYLIGKHFSFGVGFSIIYLKEKKLIYRDYSRYSIVTNEENEYKEWATKAGLQFRFYF